MIALRLVSLSALLLPLSSAQQPTQPPTSAQQQAAQDEQAQQRARATRLRQAGAQQKPRLTSELGVFTVMSDDTLRAGAIATRADDIHRHLQQLIALPSKSQYMILIELVGDTRALPVLHPYQMSIDMLDDAPIVRLNIHVGGGIDVRELHRAIVRASLYEYALRSIDLAAYDGESALSMPLWLSSGIEQAILWRGGRLDRTMFKELFQRSDILTVKNILSLAERSTLDMSTQQLFDVSCAALMLSLLAQEGGKQAVLAMVKDGLSVQGEADKALMAYFHELGLDDAALQKWWALELANMAAPNLMESMTPLETEAMLSDALVVSRIDGDTGRLIQTSVDSVAQLMEQDDWRNYLPYIQNKLTHLNMRAFPGYRPIIAEYQRILTLMLTEDQSSKIAPLIQPLTQLRASYRTAMGRARDYLDWYEMTHVGGEMSASFLQYLRMRALLREEQKPLNTHMDHYLRDIELLMGLDSGEDIPKSMMESPLTPAAH